MSNSDNRLKKFFDWVNADANLPSLEDLKHGHGDHDDHDDHGHDDHGHDDHGHDDHGHDDHGHDDHGTSSHEEDSEEAVEVELVDEELEYPEGLAADEDEDEGLIAKESDFVDAGRSEHVHVSKKETSRMKLFRTFYLAATSMLALGIIVALLITVAELPPFGNPNNPAVNELYTRYVEKGMEETGALNIVAAMILDYRAFDTLGEAIVLFTAVMGVIMLLRNPKGAKEG